MVSGSGSKIKQNNLIKWKWNDNKNYLKNGNRITTKIFYKIKNNNRIKTKIKEMERNRIENYSKNWHVRNTNRISLSTA